MNVASRWEWRAFGEDFGPAEQRVHEASREERPREEIYLISPWTDLNVTIRDSAIEVKSLDRKHASGLEKWRPAPQSQFPLEPAVVGALLADWHVEFEPIRSKRRFSDVRLLSFLGDIAPAIAIVPVTKRRRVGALAGCLVESSTVHVEGEMIRTLAIEHEDPARVLAVLTDLGLAACDNMNYVSELRRVHAQRRPQSDRLLHAPGRSIHV